MKHFDPDERMTFAYLDKDEVPVLCSWFEWKEWWKREADRCQLRYDRIDDWEIETRFQGCSTALAQRLAERNARIATSKNSNSAKNLWPQKVADAHRKEVLEDRLRELVISGRLDLRTAQQAIASDWIAAYQKYVEAPKPSP